MIDKEELCEKIIALYPDIGECGIDVNVEPAIASAFPVACYGVSERIK